MSDAQPEPPAPSPDLDPPTRGGPLCGHHPDCAYADGFKAGIEAAARACEDHTGHWDLDGLPQNHTDGAKRCCVAETIRALRGESK